MNNNIWRECGTRKEDIVRAFATLNFSTEIIKGSDYKAKLDAIRQALGRKHPVVVCCAIKPKEYYRHYAVVIDIDDDSIYVRDPYPRKRKSVKPRRIGFDVFEEVSPEIGQLVWGRLKWGIEVIQ